jgi:hypothetical protein
MDRHKDNADETMLLTKALPVLLLIMLAPAFLDQNSFSIKSVSLDSTIENFTQTLKNQIRELVTEAVNKSSGIGGSTTSIVNATNTNGSSVVSSQVVLSNNDSFTRRSGINTTGVSTQISNVNGVCTSNIIGGLGNETLSSKGICNDQLTGGAGADTFVCGQGNDIIRDYNASEGDRLVDEGNCETVS